MMNSPKSAYQQGKQLAEMLSGVGQTLLEVKKALTGLDQRLKAVEELTVDADLRGTLVVIGRRLDALEKVLRSCDG